MQNSSFSAKHTIDFPPNTRLIFGQTHDWFPAKHTNGQIYSLYHRSLWKIDINHILPIGCLKD